MTLAEAKTRLAERAEEFACWLFPNGRREGSNWLVGSLCGEPGKSLSISIRGEKAGVFCDFANGEKGSNLVELYRQAKGVEFGQALSDCAEWLGAPITRLQSRPASQVPAKPAWKPYAMTTAEVHCCVHFAEALLRDPVAIRSIARARKWQEDTVRNLSLDPCLGLDDGQLVYIYPTGAKKRLKPLTPSRAESFKGRKFEWLFGAQDSLWRGDRFLPCTETVHITEGETAAISLIDAGLDNGTTEIVVAVPGANSWREEWAGAFRKLKVVIWPDADDAGAKLKNRLIESLGCVARSISVTTHEGA